MKTNRKKIAHFQSQLSESAYLEVDCIVGFTSKGRERDTSRHGHVTVDGMRVPGPENTKQTN